MSKDSSPPEAGPWADLSRRLGQDLLMTQASGKPYVRLGGVLAEWFQARGLQAHVTVTDETDYAASFVVVETSDPTASAP